MAAMPSSSSCAGTTMSKRVRAGSGGAGAGWRHDSKASKPRYAVHASTGSERATSARATGSESGYKPLQRAGTVPAMLRSVSG